MRIFSTLLLLCVLSACASPTATPAAASPTPLPPTPTAATFASRDTLTGEWLGAAKKPDGSIASLSINFDDAKLNIEPLTKTWSMTVTQNGETINLSVEGKVKDPFTQIEFTGTLTSGNLAGELTWDSQKSSVTFMPIAVVEKSLL